MATCLADEGINYSKIMPEPITFEYPTVRRDETVKENLHNVEVKDPYRWLEDPDSEETKKFVDDQNKITFKYIDSCKSKEAIKKRLTELWDYPKWGCPFKRGDKYFYFKNTGLQNQSVMYIQDTLASEARVFLDPNLLSKDGTTCLKMKVFSEDGKWFAYGLSDAGSNWTRIKTRNVETGKDCDEVIEKVKFSGLSWTKDNLGFFYSCFPEHIGKADGTETTSTLHQKLFYHRINTPQSDDVLVYYLKDKKDAEKHVNGEVSDCGNYLYVYIHESCQNNLWFFAKLSEKSGPKSGPIEIEKVFDVFEAEYEYVTNDDDVVTMKTNKNSPNYKVVQFKITDPCEKKWISLIPEHQKDVLVSCDCIDNNKLLVVYLHDVISVLEIRALKDGKLIENLKIPTGSIVSITGKRKYSEIFFYFTSFLTPGVIYHYDLKTDMEPKVFREIKLSGFDPSLYVTEQVFYTSKDGKTKVPMFIVRAKSVKLNGDNPCLLYGYGGFNISITPYFSSTRILLLKHLNGIFAVPNIRGGGEYGEKWHDDGKWFNKQNVFDDFQSAGEFLIKNKYTNKKKLAIQGGSNGGLLVGACANQRPDLFGCAIAQVGVMDMLRFHKFTIGHLWSSDYGNPDEEKHFKNLIKISPLHNVPKNCDEYPATLLLTADHDDIVVPLHSLKFAAQIQHVLGERLKHTPLLIRVEVKAGHGMGKSTSKIIEEHVDVYSFIAKTMNLSYKP